MNLARITALNRNESVIVDLTIANQTFSTILTFQIYSKKNNKLLHKFTLKYNHVKLNIKYFGKRHYHNNNSDIFIFAKNGFCLNNGSIKLISTIDNNDIINIVINKAGRTYLRHDA